MKYRVYIENAKAVLEWFSAPTLHDMEAALTHLSGLIDGPPLPLLVIDHDTDFNPPASVMQECTDLAHRFSHCIAPRIALVVQKELHYGLGRMLGVFMHEVQIFLAPFWDVEEAEQWLFAQP